MATASNSSEYKDPDVSQRNEEEMNNSVASQEESLSVGIVQFSRVSLLDASETSDCIITFNGMDFYVHTALLAPVSIYFEQCLTGEWAESVSKHIDVEILGATVRDFEWVLRCLYGGQNLQLEKKQIEGVLRIASYFQLAPLSERVQEMVLTCVTTGAEVLELNITHRVMLNKLADTIQLKENDVLSLLKVATEYCAEDLQRRCGKTLAETVLTKDAEVSQLVELPVATLIGCFSSDKMSGLGNEDALLELIMRICSVASFDETTERELAACIRLQYLSVNGIELAYKWPVVDRNNMIRALAKQRDPAAFPDIARESARQFYIAFSPELSKGVLTYFENSAVVVHHSKARAVAVVDIPCEKGKIVKVTFKLVNDKRGDEGTCFGTVSRYNVGPADYREAEGPLWRAYNGEVRELKVVKKDIAKLHPNDTATVVVDGITRKVEFVKDGKSLAEREIMPEVRWPVCYL